MSTIEFGEVDWNTEEPASSGHGNGGGSDFLRLEEGKTVVRVMGNPVKFYVNWLTLPNGKKRKVVTPIGSPALMQKLDDAGFRRSPRWMTRVLDRTSSDASEHSFKLLEIGSQIKNGITALRKDDDWGPVSKYDITITRGQPGDNPLYSVNPRPHKDLPGSLADDYKAFKERVDIERFIQPATVQEVCDLMGWDASEFESGASSSSSDDGGDFEVDFDFDQQS